MGGSRLNPDGGWRGSSVWRSSSHSSPRSIGRSSWRCRASLPVALMNSIKFATETVCRRAAVLAFRAGLVQNHRRGAPAPLLRLCVTASSRRWRYAAPSSASSRYVGCSSETGNSGGSQRPRGSFAISTFGFTPITPHWASIRVAVDPSPSPSPYQAPHATDTLRPPGWVEQIYRKPRISQKVQ